MPSWTSIYRIAAGDTIVGKILWLASYPRSGNTWLRAFLHNLFRNSIEPYDINRLRDMTLVDGEAQPLLLHVARLPGPTARACVMITDPAASRQVNIQPLAQIFALTPVETRLVAQLVQGRNVQEAARALHLKVETVRTYLKQVFQKTGTHRQVELVQLMQNGALPALGAAA